MRKKAFTLVELLVLVAIISLMAAILFPAFGLARGRARQTSCASNLKQIALAGIMYAQDYDGVALHLGDGVVRSDMKNVLGEDIPARGYAEAYYWQSLWLPYARNTQIFFDPEGYRDFRNAPRYLKVISGVPSREIWGQYGINYERLAHAVSPWYSYDLDRVGEPSQVFMVMDSWSVSPAVDGSNPPARLLGCGALGGTDDVGVGLNLPKGDSRRGDRHFGRVNVAYMDGHVKSLDARELTRLMLTTSVVGNANLFEKFVDYNLPATTTCANWTYNN